MDSMYRKKNREAGKRIPVTGKKEKQTHVADDYSPRLRPRETHPDSVDAEKRISRNLNKLNRNLVARPNETKQKVTAATAEDLDVKIETRRGLLFDRVPLGFIACCIMVVLVVMYALTLFVEVEKYAASIDRMDSKIVELKDEAAQLEVRLESKYDLDEIERIARQEYGMVAASALPKKYIFVSDEKDVWKEAEKEEKENPFEDVITFFKAFLGKDKA